MGRFAEEMTRLRDDTNHLTEKREQFINSLGIDVAVLQSGAVQMRKQFRNTHRKMAAAEKKKRDDYLTDLRAGVSDMLDEFEKERKDMAEKLCSNLRDVLENTAGSVLDIKTQTVDRLRTFHDGHDKRAREDRKNRQKFHAELSKSVIDLLKLAARDRRAFADDLAEARSAWWSPKKKMEPVDEFPEPVGSKPSAKAQFSARTRETDTSSAMGDSNETDRTERNTDDEGEKPVVEASVQDDLTRIAGIGPGRLNQLNLSGVYTFKQLSEATPEALRELLGESSRIVDVHKWIEQAKDFTQAG